MTKKDYKVFAQIIKEERDEIEKLANSPDPRITYHEISSMLHTLIDIEEKMIKVFEQDNPRFSKQKFLEYIGKR